MVLAANGYPGTPEKGTEIRGLDAARAVEGVEIFHAGTKRDGRQHASPTAGACSTLRRWGATVARGAAAGLRRRSPRSIGRAGSAAATSVGARCCARRRRVSIQR